MTPEQRQAVLDNAKYLRRVRPIDPEEIHEYVEGQPHPAAVRQVLRETAVDLGLIERGDGTFEPVSTEPVSPLSGPVGRFPEAYADALEDLLVDRFGVDWHAGGSGDDLRAAIRRLKEDYYLGNEVSYDEVAALGYAIYHLPDNYAAIQYVLEDLAERDLLGRRLGVVEVGAGAGGPALGLADFLPEDALLEYHGVEPSPAADVLEAVLAETGRNVHATVHRERAEDLDPPACDLLVFANVLSELSSPVETVERYLNALAEDGTLLLLAPADRETSTGLRRVERDVVRDRDCAVYSPTLRLWPHGEPSDRCWSFDVRADLEVPAFQRRLNDAGGGDGEFVNVDVQFSYALLRPDGTQRLALVPDEERFARMAETERHLTKRIDIVAVKLSHDLSDDGNPLFLVGDGSQAVDHYAVLAKETALNRDLLDLGYGRVLRIESALALWNDDEEAYNLVVDEETVVDPIG